jgi:hypothetical protein
MSYPTFAEQRKTAAAKLRSHKEARMVDRRRDTKVNTDRGSDNGVDVFPMKFSPKVYKHASPNTASFISKVDYRGPGENPERVK